MKRRLLTFLAGLVILIILLGYCWGLYHYHDVGDLFGDGKVHLVTGNFCLTPEYSISEAVVIRKNLGPKGK